MTRKIGWIFFAVLAMGVGLYPLLYFMIDRTFGLLSSKSAALLSNALWNTGFYAHILLGGLALFIGWTQFSKKIRTKRIKLHRRIGMVYVVSALISGTAGVYIAYHATGGPIAVAGFGMLGIVWLFTTIKAFISIKQGNLRVHQKMMIYSYAACFGAVTLRIWLPILIIIHQGEFVPAYRIVAWVSWVPNIIVAYFITRRLNLQWILSSAKR